VENESVVAARDRSGPRNQAWILAALLAGVGICLLLWKALAPASSPTRTRDDTTTQASESAPRNEVAGSAGLERPPEAERPEPTAGEQPVDDAKPAEIEAKIRLFGTIFDAGDRTPISRSPLLRITDDKWEQRMPAKGNDGAYEFSDLHEGEWELFVEAPGFQRSRLSVQLDRGEPEKQLDLFLRPALMILVRIEGAPGEDLQMLPAGSGFEFLGIRDDALKRSTTPTERRLARAAPESIGLNVMTTRLEPGRWLSENVEQVGYIVTTNPPSPPRGSGPEVERLRALGYARETNRVRLPDGSKLDDVDPRYCGVLLLAEPPPVFAILVLKDLVVRTAPIPVGADSITFQLSREEIGRLLGNVRLRVVDAETNETLSRPSVSIGATTLGTIGTNVESDGSISFANLLPGSTKLTIERSGREIVSEQIRIEPGTTTDLGTYELQALGSIEAKVVDESGEPESVLFNVFPEALNKATRVAWGERILRSGRDGVLKIVSVGRGAYVIVASDPQWSAAPVLVDGSTPRRPVEIRVSKGTAVALRLRGEPPPNGWLVIRASSGLAMAERACHSRDPMRFRLAPGNYSVELSDGEKWLWSEGIAVGTEPLRSYLPR
jgi:hypothetical protein